MWRLRLAYFLGTDPARLARAYGYVEGAETGTEASNSLLNDLNLRAFLATEVERPGMVLRVFLLLMRTSVTTACLPPQARQILARFRSSPFMLDSNARHA